MGSGRLLAGNLASVAITVLGFLQLLPWPVAGLLITASAVIAILPYFHPPKRHMGPVSGQTVSKPAKTVQERHVERVGGGSERRAVVQRLEPKRERKRLVSMKSVVQKEKPRREAPQREEAREKPERIAVDDYLRFDLELENGEEVVGEVSASGEVNVYVLSEESLTNLDLGQEFWYEAGSEGVQNATVRFAAPEAGKWFLVVENVDTGDVSATVRISVKRTSHSVPFLRTENLGLPSEKLEGKL